MTAARVWTLANGDGDTWREPVLGNWTTVTRRPLAVTMDRVLARAGSTFTYSKTRPANTSSTGVKTISSPSRSPANNSRLSNRP